MKKYTEKILESNLTRNEFVMKLSDLRQGDDRFIVSRFGLGLFDLINKMLQEISKPYNANDDYQLPLSYLFSTGKYPDIKKIGDKYSSDKLKNLFIIVGDEEKYHPVNKLNTNYLDQAELLYDLFNKIGVYDQIPNEENDMKRWLMEFKSKNDLYKLIKSNLDFRNYTKWNRKNSKKGEIAEEIVKNVLISKGCDILYQGGDGDFIDMVYGIDIIVSKNDIIYTVQVKNNEDSTKLALKKSANPNSSYNKIDWFCSPSGGGNMMIFTKSNTDGKYV